MHIQRIIKFICKYLKMLELFFSLFNSSPPSPRPLHLTQRYSIKDAMAMETEIAVDEILNIDAAGPSMT